MPRTYEKVKIKVKGNVVIPFRSKSPLKLQNTNQVKKIAQLVQSELKKQDKKQKDLAEFMGISEPALSRLLSADTLKPQYMQKIKSFLGLDVNFLNFNSNMKAVSQENTGESNADADVEHLKELIRAKDEIIAAKNDLIETLKEKLKK